MVTNALRETKLSATLCRLSPPSSPSKARLRSTSSSASTSNKPRSKILATLDAEIPNWLVAPLPKLPTRSAAPNKNLDIANTLLKSHSPFSMGAVVSSPIIGPSDPLRTSGGASSKPVSKGKAKASVSLPLQRTTSDIENHPDIATFTTSRHVSGANVGPVLEKDTSPLYSYKQYSPPPAVVYTRHEEEANDLVGCLKGPLGFDLEWPVVFRRGRTPMERRTALVQICDSRMILLVQVSAMSKFPQKVKEVIEDKDVLKLGANIRNDGQKLFRDFGLLPAGLVELGALARQADLTFSQSFNRSIVALAKIVERYTGKTLDKGKVRTSDWEAKLSQHQIAYAANDAHCALMVYNVLMAMAKKNDGEIRWEDCSSDLRKVYQEKTAATVAAAAATVPQIAPTVGEHAAAGTAQNTPAAPTLQAEPHAPAALSTTASASSVTASGSSTSHIKVYSRPLAYVGDFEPTTTITTNRSSASRHSPSTGASGTYSSTPSGPPRPQHLRAYNMWHHRKMDLRDICAALRSKENPLAESTVISYVVRALQADPSLSYDMDCLKSFVQLEAGSWVRHREWILQQVGYKK